MAMPLRSGNPALNESTFRNLPRTFDDRNTMTIEGSINKTGIMLLLVIVGAAFTWQMALSGETATAMTVAMGGALGGFIFAMVTIFKKTWASVTAPIYAVLEGLFLGGISATVYNGLAMNAVMLTFGTAFVMLLAYRSGLVRATEKFKTGIIAATGGIALIYLVTIVLGFFGVSIPYIHSAGPIGIGFSLVVTGIAAFNLVLDFDFIERGAAQGAPKYMEWYGAFGLIVTLVWLYLELLRLLSKLQSRR